MADITSIRSLNEEQISDSNTFKEIPLALQVLASVIVLFYCIYEATYKRRVKKRDNKERFEEYKRRYKWD